MSLPSRVQNALPQLYLALALPITLLLCFLTAPFFAPDEAAQSLRAIALAHGNLLPAMGPHEPGGQIDEGVIQTMDAVDDIRMDWERRAADFHNRPWGPMPEDAQRRIATLRWTHTTAFEPFGNTAVYPPTFYLPAIVGWRIGEAADLTIFQSLRLARVLSALAAVALGWLALRLCACSRWVLLPFLLLPSTLFLNASSSQDALLLPAIALMVAILSRPLSAQRDFTAMELAFASGLLAMCVAARPPYAAMALVLSLPWVELRRADKRLPLKTGAAFAAVVATVALWQHLVLPFGVDKADAANPRLQWLFLRSHPIAGAGAVVRGTGAAAIDFLRRGVYVVGWNDLLPHHGLAPALVLGMAAVVVLAPAYPIRTWRGGALLAMATIAPLLSISLAEYVIWTPPGGPTVYGIQPRYWLSVMPFAFMLLQGLAWRQQNSINNSQIKQAILLTALALLAIVACTLPWMAAHAFYRDTVWHVFRFNLE